MSSLTPKEKMTKEDVIKEINIQLSEQISKKACIVVSFRVALGQGGIRGFKLATEETIK